MKYIKFNLFSLLTICSLYTYAGSLSTSSYTYEGDLKNGVRDGFGQDKMHSGFDKYIGFYKDGKRNGFGLHVSADTVTVTTPLSSKNMRIVYMQKERLVGITDLSNGVGDKASFFSLFNPYDLSGVEVGFFGQTKNRKKSGFGIEIKSGSVFYSFYENGSPIGRILALNVRGDGYVWVYELLPGTKKNINCLNLQTKSFFNCSFDGEKGFKVEGKIGSLRL